MTSNFKNVALFAASIALTTLLATTAQAQVSAIVSDAKSADTVGEQADGYLGLRGAAAANVKTAVESINIQRRAAYTKIATERGVTVHEAGAAVGCQTLANRVSTGQIYLLPDDTWHTKTAGPIALPSYCAQ